jgi:cell division septal protein FtsQ
MGMQGQDIFLLDQAVLVSRLEALPMVAAANLNVQLPSTVTISVQERMPVLLWQAGKLTFGLAQDGTVIAPQNELSGVDHLALVVDTRRTASQIRSGSRFSAADIVFVEQVFEQVPGIEGVAPFSLQYADTITEDGHSAPANQAGSGSYVIVSANGWRAYLGSSQNSNSLANRLAELQQIVSIARQQNVQLATVDLRFGLRPTYTLKP